MSSTRSKNVPQPGEVEAWKVMMDSMVKFIAASTKLMKTITDRAETTPTPSVNSAKCEIECILCPTSSPEECGVCTTKPSRIPVKTKQPSPTVQEEEEALKEDSEELPREEGGEALKDNNEEQEEGEKPQEEADKPVEGDVVTEAGTTAEAGDKNNNNCVCEEIDAINEHAANAGVDVKQRRKKRDKRADKKDSKRSCACKKSAKCGGAEGSESERMLCACDLNPEEKTQLTNDLADKLSKAQENLSQLQTEVAKLQQLDSSKNKQSAALYKEIMKDTSLGPETPVSCRAPPCYQPQNLNEDVYPSSPSTQYLSLPENADMSRVVYPGTPTSQYSSYQAPSPGSTPRNVRPRPPSSTPQHRRGYTSRKRLDFDEETCSENNCQPKNSTMRSGLSDSGTGAGLSYNTSPGLSPIYPPGAQSASYPSYKEQCSALRSQQGRSQPFYSLGANKVSTNSKIQSVGSAPCQGPPALKSLRTLYISTPLRRYTSVLRSATYQTPNTPSSQPYTTSGRIQQEPLSPRTPQNQKWPTYPSTGLNTVGYRAVKVPPTPQVPISPYSPPEGPGGQYMQAEFSPVAVNDGRFVNRSYFYGGQDEDDASDRCEDDDCDESCYY